MVSAFRLVAALSTVVATTLASPLHAAERDIVERSKAESVLPASSLALRQQSSINPGVSCQYDYDHFDASWATSEPFSCGIIWSPGNSAPIKYSGTFNVQEGTAQLAVYGWTVNPLVEYYIIETATPPFPNGGAQKGTVVTDDGTYGIWEATRAGQPSIDNPTGPYQQFFSVRTSGELSGAITVQNHFDAWAQLGMVLGTSMYQVFGVDVGYGHGSATESVIRL